MAKKNDIVVGHGEVTHHVDYTKILFPDVDLDEILSEHFKGLVVDVDSMGNYPTQLDYVNYLIYTFYLRAQVFVCKSYNPRLIPSLRDGDIIIHNNEPTIYYAGPYHELTDLAFKQPLYYLNTSVDVKVEFDPRELKLNFTDSDIKAYYDGWLDLTCFWLFTYNNVRYAIYTDGAQRDDCISQRQQRDECVSRLLPRINTAMTLKVRDPEVNAQSHVCTHIHETYNVNYALIMEYKQT